MSLTRVFLVTPAVLIAAVFELSGAIGLGGEVVKTISGGIARPSAFQVRVHVSPPRAAGG